MKQSRVLTVILLMIVLVVVITVLLATPTARAQVSNEPQTVPTVDLVRYQGKWFEIAAIPQNFQRQCVANTTAEYSAAENGLIKVLNSCDTDRGYRAEAEGRARIDDSRPGFETNAKLKVTFAKFFDWIFAFGGNYWILGLDSSYSYAVVGDPTRDYAWILSRTQVMARADLVAAEQTLRDQGYDTCRLMTSVQAGGFGDRRPLCDVVK